jgi:hypothetical protein
MKNLEKKACSHCEEEGHPASKCPGNCPNFKAIHSIKGYTTRHDTYEKAMITPLTSAPWTS